MKRGKFIVLEGGEGSGKTSCLYFLKEKFSNGGNIIFTREPGGTSVGEKVRTILLQEEMHILTELFLFCGVRSEVVRKIIRPALESGKHVVCDRFYQSTETYQIRRSGLETKYLQPFRQLNSITVEDCIPDIVIYLDVLPEIGLARRQKSSEGVCTKFDKEGLEEHHKIRNAYLAQYEEAKSEKSQKPRWHLISTTDMTKEEVEVAILNIIEREITR